MQGELENSSSLNGSGALPLEPGDPRRIGAFRLLGVLGSGGMGRVHLGAVPGKFAAVKRVLPVLAEDAEFLSHFGHELDNLARLPAGASAKLLASDRTAKPPWFATEYIPGITLNEAVRLHGGPLPPEALWLLLREAAAGLRSVHAAEMVHRDLKPSNVMLTAGGLSLIDFGVARAADQSRLTRTGMAIGTPAYMAPEQAVADPRLTGAADVFALGSLVLYAAVGRPPFGDGSGPGLLYRIVHGEPEVGKLAETAPALLEVVRSCLAKDPADRPTAAELVGRAEEGAAGAAWPPAVAERIAERTAFAAGAPTAAHLAELEAAEPSEDIATASLTPRSRQEPVTGPSGPERRKERRNRFVMLAVPVVVATGTTLTVALGPYEIGRSSAGPRPSASPSAVVTAPAPGGPAPVAPSSPSSSAKVSTSPTPASKPPGTGTAVPPPPPAHGGAGGGAGGGTGGPATGGATTGTGTAPGTNPGSGSGPGSGGGSGAGSSGSSGGTTTRPATIPPQTTRPAPPPPAPSTGSAPSGTYSLESGTSGDCLAEYDAGFSHLVTTVACGSRGTNATYRFAWTYRPASDGSFRLVNATTGRCLQPAGNTSVTTSACNGSAVQSWKVLSSSSVGRTLRNASDGNCLTGGSFAMTYPCGAGGSQLWRNIGAR
ncbi:protein kinase [Streptomyces sp.]|uniref:serine/threonine-protein kinase n=1 Tax=Streptomyces sp. TaxID=1931 RepID=UPI002810CCC0|nr:protein kinase [Streptomyces sp.]